MKKILIIDDDKDILDSVGLVLRLSGYEIAVLQEASKIAHHVRTEQPNIILLDINLSGLDGRTLCYLLKANMQFYATPIIIFSAAPMDPDEIRRCGADDFIAKPFEMEALVQKIESMQPFSQRTSL